MTFQFDWQNKIIEVPSGTVSVEVQNLINEIRTAEATISGIKQPKIADASGKDELAPGVLVGITVNLLDNWQLRFAPGNYTVTVAGGNLVGGYVGDPVAYSAGVQVVLIQSASATIVETGGSALTEEESNYLLGLPSAGSTADAVWDEVLTGATHDVATSAGKRLRQLGNVVDGAVNDASATTERFISNLSATYSGFYNDQTIRFTSGNLEGQARVVLDYDNVTQAIVVDEPWSVAPGNGDDFEVVPDHVHPVHQIVEELETTLADVPSGVWTYTDRSLTQDIVASGGGLTQEEHDHLLALDTSSLPSIATSVEDALGVAGENVKWSGMAFDSNDYLISAVITQYTDNTLTVERKKWQLTASYDAQGRITSYQLKEY